MADRLTGKTPTIAGVVIHSTLADDPDKGWGKIEPAGGGEHVWFGTYAAQGKLFERGDLVEFLPHNSPKDPDRPAAFRVYMKRKSIN
jgi:cold shock CspA family protein